MQRRNYFCQNRWLLKTVHKCIHALISAWRFKSTKKFKIPSLGFDLDALIHGGNSTVFQRWGLYCGVISCILHFFSKSPWFIHMNLFIGTRPTVKISALKHFISTLHHSLSLFHRTSTKQSWIKRKCTSAIFTSCMTCIWKRRITQVLKHDVNQK